MTHDGLFHSALHSWKPKTGLSEKREILRPQVQSVAASGSTILLHRLTNKSLQNKIILSFTNVMCFL